MSFLLRHKFLLIAVLVILAAIFATRIRRGNRAMNPPIPATSVESVQPAVEETGDATPTGKVEH